MGVPLATPTRNSDNQTKPNYRLPEFLLVVSLSDPNDDGAFTGNLRRTEISKRPFIKVI